MLESPARRTRSPSDPWLAISSRPSPSPKAIPTRWRTRSPTRCSTRCSRRTRHGRVAAETLVQHRSRRHGRPDHDQRERRLRADRARRDQAHRLRRRRLGIDYRAARCSSAYDKQSPDIAQGVDEGKGLDLEQGAGDQGLMFGYACDETPQLMPLPIYLAHRLMERQSETAPRRPAAVAAARREVAGDGALRRRQARRTSTPSCISTQHRPDISHEPLTEAVIEEIVKPVLPEEPRARARPSI